MDWDEMDCDRMQWGRTEWNRMGWSVVVVGWDHLPVILTTYSYYLYLGVLLTTC